MDNELEIRFKAVYQACALRLTNALDEIHNLQGEIAVLRAQLEEAKKNDNPA